MAIKFEETQNSLHLVYTPDYPDWIDGFKRKIDNDGYLLARTFHLDKTTLVSEFDELNDYDDAFIFKIGEIEGDYIALNKDVFMTDCQFFVAKDIKIDKKLFTYNSWRTNVPILPYLDKLSSSDYIYIGGNNENAIPLDAYKKAIEFFPKKAELKKYTDARISMILNEYFPYLSKHEVVFDRFIEKKNDNLRRSLNIKPNDRYLENLKLNIQQFSKLKDELSELLEISPGMSEKEWQENIHQIICLLFPKYILSVREVKIPGIDKTDKQVDFMLVDYNGNVDLLEIKKPQVEIITDRASYRNNYIPRRDLSGSVQQIQKYIHCLNKWGREGDTKLNQKYKNRLPESVNICVTNPKGMLILGRSNNLSQRQLNDLELMKRQFTNIFEIMTYDDLIQRIDNILEMLKKNLSSS